jgi:hypothetical protein
MRFKNPLAKSASLSYFSSKSYMSGNFVSFNPLIEY